MSNFTMRQKMAEISFSTFVCEHVKDSVFSTRECILCQEKRHYGKRKKDPIEVKKDEPYSKEEQITVKISRTPKVKWSERFDIFEIFDLSDDETDEETTNFDADLQEEKLTPKLLIKAKRPKPILKHKANCVVVVHTD